MPAISCCMLGVSGRGVRAASASENASIVDGGVRTGSDADLPRMCRPSRCGFEGVRVNGLPGVDNPLVAVYLVRAVRPLIENARSLVWGRPTNPELEKGGVAAARIGGRLSLVRGRPYRASMAEGRAARIEGGDVCAGARLQPHATGGEGVVESWY